MTRRRHSTLRGRCLSMLWLTLATPAVIAAVWAAGLGAQWVVARVAGVR